jgi:hypothetical protein
MHYFALCCATSVVGTAVLPDKNDNSILSSTADLQGLTCLFQTGGYKNKSDTTPAVVSVQIAIKDFYMSSKLTFRMKVAPGLNIVSASNKGDGAYAYVNARIFCIVLSFRSVVCRQVPFLVWHFSSVPTCCWRCGSCFVSCTQGNSIRSQCIHIHILLARR